VVKNIFLSQLLTLQQDGQGAISGPVNWAEPPLLQVRTDLNNVVDDLVASFSDQEEVTGRWHFFVGSPGNGKSAGVGLLVQELRGRLHSIRQSETGAPIDELEKSIVPYRLDVCRPNQGYPYLFLAQDASVLPNAFDTEADPANALIELLQGAASRGVSLVVCTNRGVIERAYARANMDFSSSKASWYNALRIAVSGSGTAEVLTLEKSSNKRVYERIKVTSTSLDRRSLVLGADTFSRLIERGIEPSRWESCKECAAQSLCPFRANRDWLAQPKLRENFLRLIRHAELVEGQIIVLREALALISLVLSGCPHDYSDGSPCHWVQRLAAKGDIFGLASRRIYMLLFSSSSPMGLEDDVIDRRLQTEDFNFIAKYGGGTSDKTLKAIAAIADRKKWPSTDVGATRLLGRNGTFSQLDVLSDTLTEAFSERWDESSEVLSQTQQWASGIEAALDECWRDLQNAAVTSQEQTPNAYRWLARWSTAFTFRIGSLVDGVTAYGRDLDALSEILEIRGTPTAQQAAILTDIEATLAVSLASMDEGLSLSPTTTLHGGWAKAALRPKFPPAEPGAIAISLRFGKEDANQLLNTRAFIWLKRRAERNMDSATFPREYLETARDAMLRVAANLAYDTKDDVILKIEGFNEDLIEVRRAHGGVYVDYT
jgi:hypothetical protein